MLIRLEQKCKKLQNFYFTNKYNHLIDMQILYTQRLLY